MGIVNRPHCWWGVFNLLGSQLLLAPACTTVQETGRSQFIITSESQEAKLGLEAYQEVLRSSKLSADQKMIQIVRRVGQRIAAAAKKPDFQWEFNLIESEQVNAFCLPGGKIAVFTGILPYMQNEAGMAVVMGHEVGHAIARHGGERMSQNVLAGGIQKGLEIGLGSSDPQTRDGIMQAFGLGSQVGVLLPYSRKHELEADQIGLKLAAQAGYDPREAPVFWERMSASGGKKPPEILSTHPSEKHRINQMEELMPDALKAYEAAPQKFGQGEQWATAPPAADAKQESPAPQVQVDTGGGQLRTTKEGTGVRKPAPRKDEIRGPKRQTRTQKEEIKKR